jgi:hypothetical protein
MSYDLTLIRTVVGMDPMEADALLSEYQEQVYIGQSPEMPNGLVTLDRVDHDRVGTIFCSVFPDASPIERPDGSVEWTSEASGLQCSCGEHRVSITVPYWEQNTSDQFVESLKTFLVRLCAELGLAVCDPQSDRAWRLPDDSTEFMHDLRGTFAHVRKAMSDMPHHVSSKRPWWRIW